jgi:hypothetical protein
MEQSLSMMSMKVYFSVIRDPRIGRNKLYLFHDVIVIPAAIGIVQG